MPASHPSPSASAVEPDSGDSAPPSARAMMPRPGASTTLLSHPLIAVAEVEGGRVQKSNAAWKRLFALPDDVSVDSHVAALFPSAQTAGRFEKTLQTRLVPGSDGDGAHALAEQTLTRRDATTFTAELVIWPQPPFDADRLLAADGIWQVRDVSAEKELRAELRGLEDYYKELTRFQDDLTFVIDRKGRLSYVSASVEHVLGYRTEVLLGESFAKLFDSEHRAGVGQWLRTASRGPADIGEDVRPYRLHVVDQLGRKRVLACRPRNCFSLPRIAGLVVHARDVTDQTAADVGLLTAEAHDDALPVFDERPVERRGLDSDLLPDPLTGLPGRVAAHRLLAECFGTAVRASAPLLALVIDIDRLRDVNDRHGHAIGDAVIARAARLLESGLPGNEFVARVGDDQFLAVLHEAAGNDVDATLQKLLDSFAAPEAVGGVDAADDERPGGDSAVSGLGLNDEALRDDPLPRIEISIGVARTAPDVTDGEALWRRAELATREAKARGRGQAVFFQPRLAAAVAARKALGDEIEDAMKRSEFALFYQPQVALASGRIVGFEAFLRWQHPTRGLLLPDMFIDAAIDRGLIEAITRTVFAQVCEQIVGWQRVAGFPDVPVSVNISGQQFHDRRLPAIVASALMRSSLPARSLVLEVIEENFFDAAAMERVVGELTRLGVRLSIGSFGLGHASLRSLRQLGVAQIKLNRGFVGGLPNDEESAIVVRAAIEIAHRLKCQVVAEGVETLEQFERLLAMGCEAGQGFYFGAPLSAGDIPSFVEADRSKPGR